MKPIIGVVSRVVKDQSRDWYPSSQGVIDSYIQAIHESGGVPMIIPILDDSEDVSQLYRKVDGLLLAGGGDVHPTFYREKPHSKLDGNNITQDKVELTLASWAVLDKKPLLGICRGLQIINVSLGGSLHQDLQEAYETPINHDESFQLQDFSYLVHHLLLDESSRLAKTLGSLKIPVNSMHHQSIKELAPTLTAVGWADDGVIEAVESNTEHYIYGIQSHPEVLRKVQDGPWENLLQDFVEACNYPTNVKAALP